MNFKHLLFEAQERIGIITMNRPTAMNALSSEVLTEFDEVLTHIERDATVKGIIITGNGKAFVAGADISQMAHYGPEEARAYMGSAQAVFNRVEAIEKPFMAAVNGYALGGGCELSMACDFRFCSEKAMFGQPEVNLGVMPGFGGSQRLPRLVPTGVAREIVFSGRMVKADEALRIGLVNKVCAPETLMAESIECMKVIVGKPASALRYCKVAMLRGQDADLYKGIELERDLIALCFSTEDQKEGMKAFLEKRPPQFRS